MRRMTKNQFNTLIAVSAFLAIASQWFGFQTVFSFLKPLTTILVICLLALFRVEEFKYTTLVVVALIFCLGGDVMLLDDARFAFGLASFLLAHLIFVYIFYRMAAGKLHYAPLIALVAMGIGFYYVLHKELGELAIPVGVYLMCILVMCWLAINLYLVRADLLSRILAAAGIVFVFSDTIIAVNKFLLPFQLAQVVILASYWLSIALIANAFTSETLGEDQRSASTT